MQSIYRDNEYDERAHDWSSSVFLDDDMPCYLYSGSVLQSHKYSKESSHGYIIVDLGCGAIKHQGLYCSGYPLSDENVVADAVTAIFGNLEDPTCRHSILHGAAKASPIIDWSAVPVIGRNLLYGSDVVESPVEREFLEHAKKWSDETAYFSSSTQIVLHPSYQRIIGLGPDVLPFIFRDLLSEDRDWFWALLAITGDNPVAPEDAGDVPKMLQSWLRWGKDHGYI